MQCEHLRTEKKLRSDTQHHAQLLCLDCGKHVKWIPKEKDGRKGTSKYSLKQVQVFYNCFVCFFCTRNDGELGMMECLTRDHIIPLVDGGSDVLKNLQVLCTACHKLKNWNVIYIKNHLFGDKE